MSSGPSEQTLAPIRVLLIDDEPDKLKAHIRFLTDHRCEVELATNGASGLESVRRQRFDAIILDYKMKGMSGIEVLEHLRREGNRTPVIVLTGFGTPEIGFDAGRLGAVAYKAKPISRSELLDCVRKVVGEAHKPAGARPLFPHLGTGATPDSVRDVLEGLDDIEMFLPIGGSESPNEQVTDRLAGPLARALADPGLTFVEFTACARALRLLHADPPRPLLTATARIREWLEEAIGRDSAGVDPRAAHVLSRFEAAAKDWRAVTEPLILAELAVHRSTLWRLLIDQFGVGFPQCRRAVVMRRAILALAETDEQVAQIAYALGYDDLRLFDRSLGAFLKTSPTRFRRILKGPALPAATK